VNIEYLRNFIKLTQYKSFSKLAVELPISQSTLSHQILQLEKEFGGVVLIDRTTKKFELTKAGIHLRKYAEKIIDLYDSCRLEISKFQDEMKEDIIISASTIPGSHILPKFIADFRTKNPNANFKILINNSKKSLENFSRSQTNSSNSLFLSTLFLIRVIKASSTSSRFFCKTLIVAFLSRSGILLHLGQRIVSFFLTSNEPQLAQGIFFHKS